MLIIHRFQSIRENDQKGCWISHQENYIHIVMPMRYMLLLSRGTSNSCLIFQVEHWRFQSSLGSSCEELHGEGASMFSLPIPKTFTIAILWGLVNILSHNSWFSSLFLTPLIFVFMFYYPSCGFFKCQIVGGGDTSQKTLFFNEILGFLLQVPMKWSRLVYRDCSWLLEWWFNFCIHKTGSQGAQIFGQTFLWVCLCVFRWD